MVAIKYQPPPRFNLSHEKGASLTISKALAKSKPVASVESQTIRLFA